MLMLRNGYNLTMIILVVPLMNGVPGTQIHTIIDIVSSSAPAFKDQICFKFYDTSIFSVLPSLDDIYKYQGISSFILDCNNQFTSSHFPYLKRCLNRVKRIPTIPASGSQACYHKYAHEIMQALGDELLSLRDIECYRHYFGDQLVIPKGHLINSKIMFDILCLTPMGPLNSLKLIELLVETNQISLIYTTLLQ